MHFDGIVSPIKDEPNRSSFSQMPTSFRKKFCAAHSGFSATGLCFTSFLSLSLKR